MKIWIFLNGIQQGPYDLEQLGQLPIEASTPVWYDSLEAWTPAGAAPATASLFALPADPTPPPPTAPVEPSHRPPTYIGWSILLTVCCCCPAGIAAIITGAITSSRWNSGDHEGALQMSHITEWLLIVTIVLAFISGPFGLTCLLPLF